MRCCSSKEGLKQKLQACLNLTVEIQNRLSLAIVDQTDRQLTAQFTPARLIQKTATKPRY